MHVWRTALIGAVMCAVAGSSMTAAFAAEEEEAGNNLSVPLLWSEAAYPPPITTPVTEQFEGAVRPGHVIARDETSAECDGALQKDAGNVWQGDVALAEGGAITTVDWGDNLEAMDPNLSRAYTRVEMGLYSALAEPATGYDMCWIEGRGQNEVWGAQVTGGSGNWAAVTSERLEAMVFTAGARLTIQRIVPDRTYTWNPTTHQWQGSGADAPYFNAAIHEGAPDGPGSFGSEVTVSGRLSYGYLWDANTVPQGEYRLTFSLDGATGAFSGSGTSMSGASVLVSEEEELMALATEDISATAEGSGNSAVMRGDLELTYLDVTVGTRTDPIPDEEPVTPPPSGPPASGGSTPPSSSAADTPGPQAGPQGPVEVAVPAAATALIQQTARIRARKAGTYRVGQTLVLTPRPIYTDAGVTVRWRERVTDRDQCTVKVRKGMATVTLDKPGKCTVIGWAPAPSPDYASFRWTRTYRAVAR